ncbi:MAG: hypothetical protein K5668_10005 [Lachnospiraceae bacterium]|nr:hypothetical protein [Lachnospiraceae bacterium]
MKAEKTRFRLLAFLLMAMLMTAAVPNPIYAEEAPAEEAAGEEGEGGEENPEAGEEGELSEEEALAQAEAAQAALETVVPSDISTNIDGKYLALSFPASEVPEGFAVKTVDYQGQQVMLAYMTSKSATIGAAGLTVTLAYLTDENGGNGEFYLCDTTENAKMSDMIMIDGAPGRYIIILDPGDNVVGPDGFSKHRLQWGSKTATAWSLPEQTVEEEESEKDGSEKDEKSDKEEDESKKEASLFGVKVYAAELNLNAGEAARGGSAGDVSAAPADDGAEAVDMPAEDSGDDGGAAVDNPAVEDSGDKVDNSAMGDSGEDDNSMLTLDSIAHTNASGLIQAQPKEFCLLYAIDESGNLGFYLYDIERGTYQRYVDIPKGESETLTKYKKLSRTRLFIIIVLAIFLVISLFVLVNMMLNRRGDEYDEDEEDPEEEAMRKRAKAKERKNIGRGERAYLLEDEPEDDEDFEDDYEEDDEDDYEDEDEDEYEDDEEEDEPEGPRESVRHRSITRKDIRQEKRSKPEFDFDEDFDFEFLDVKK